MFNSDWYYNLIRPPFAPPNWIFAPAWTILYTTIIAALILFIIKKTTQNKRRGYIYFAIQLILNLLWSPVFFAMQSIGIAFIIILLLDLFVLLTIKNFYSVSKFAGLILIPYFIWILYATYLNGAYLVLN